MSRTFFDEVTRAGVRSRVLLDQDRGLVVRTDQDTAAILEANQADALAYDVRHERRSGGYRKVASIPFVVWQQLARLGIVQLRPLRVLDEKAFLAVLSDPALRKLRTDNGRRLA